MKIRNGFVSNSSTSSFCIIGKILDSKDFIKKFNIDSKKFKLMKKEWEEWGGDHKISKDLFFYSLSSEWTKFLVCIHLNGSMAECEINALFSKFKDVYGEDGKLYSGIMYDDGSLDYME